MSITASLRDALLVLLLVAGNAFAADSINVIYQFSTGLEQASRGLRNMQNHLEADPNVQIVAVSFGPGVDFLLDGAKDANGTPYDVIVANLASKGVEFRVCNKTLIVRKIDPTRVAPIAKVIPSGVVEVTRMQAKEGFVYFQP